MKKCTGNESGDHEHCEDIGEYVVCHDCETTLGRKTEVWARVVGYLRPVDGFNPGMKAQKRLRKDFVLE